MTIGKDGTGGAGNDVPMIRDGVITKRYPCQSDKKKKKYL